MPYLTHPSGQKTFYYDDCFVDPWKQPVETILIHHVFGRNSNFWYKWVPILAQKYRVIRRDALGHGYSSAPPQRPENPDVVLDELIDTLNQLQIDKVHFLGESTGGIFGELLAARNPERFHSLAICGSPFAYGKAGQDLLAFGYPGPSEALAGLGLREWAKRSAEAIGTSNDAHATEAFNSWWVDTASIAPVEGVRAYCDVICRKDFDARLVMERITVPMLILTPAASPLVPIEDQERLAATVKARLEIIPSQGHEIYLNHPEMCWGKYMDFLGGLKA